MHLYLIRHGETVIGPDKLYPDGAGLTLRGQAQARAVASALRERGVDLIVTSGLRRTYETARPLTRALGLSPVAMPGLNEIYAGRLRDAPIETIQEIADSGWKPDFKRFGGEDMGDFGRRIAESSRCLLDTAASKGAETVAAFVHGGTITVMLEQVKGQPFSGQRFDYVPNCSISLVCANGTGTEIRYKFDTNHLADV
ncbi:MAG: histidine phosphatase family protein [Dehalococcoidia bacterium]